VNHGRKDEPLASCAAKRTVRTAVLAMSVGLLTACGGGVGGNQAIPMTPGATATGSGHVVPMSTATAAPTVTASGTVAGLFSGGFTLQTGSPYGKINVYTNASTQFVGAAPFLNESVSVSGTGSLDTSITATSVTQAGITPAPQATYVPTITTSGTIVGLFSGGFTLNTGSPHGKINVDTNASTQFIGATPYVGESVTINGTGSWDPGPLTAIWVTQAGYATPAPVVAPTPVATSTPVAVANVPVHIPTWAYDETGWEGGSAAAASVQKYLTYAEGGLGNGKAQSDCSTSPKVCYSVAYTNPNLVYSDALCPYLPDATFIAASSESWFVHLSGYSDAAHRVQGSYSRTCNGTAETDPVYLEDQANPAVVAWWNSFIQQNLDSWDYFWLDSTSTSVAGQAFGPGGSFCPGVSACSATQEYPTDASVLAAHISFSDGLSHVNGSALQYFFNGVQFNSGNIENTALLSQDPSHFVGAVCENCVVESGVLQPANYAQVLNGMLAVNGITGAHFVQLDTGSSASGSAAQISQRTVALAIAWLAYQDGHTVIFPNFEYTTDNLAVWPEDLIYPGAPVQTMQWSANDLAVVGSVYRREFRQCFNAQQAIGPCAAIVNASSSTVTVASSWLAQTYGHQITPQGGDLLDGGTLSLTSTTFTPNVTTIAPGQAILLTP
jgi:hypothetical protein